MDVVSYTLNPQVHAFDNASITETLAAQPETVRSARAIVGDRARRGANHPATAVQPERDWTGTETGSGERPSSDYRQPSLSPPAGSREASMRLATPSVDGLTYFETTGWKGLIERRDHPLRVAGFHSCRHGIPPLSRAGGCRRFPGRTYLAGHAGRWTARAGAGVSRRRPGARHPGEHGRRAVGPCLTGDSAGRAPQILRRLDDETVYLAATDPGAFRTSAEPIGVTNGTVTVDLPPFGLATVDVQGATA